MSVRLAVAAACVVAMLLTPVPSPAHAQTRTILLVGDSLMDQTKDALAPLLADAGWNAVFHTAPGTGLLDADLDWVAEMQHLVDEYDPQIAVAEFAGNYFGTDPAPGSAGFYAAWSGRANQAATALASRGAQVAWVLNPPMRDPTLDAESDMVDAITIGLSLGHPGLRVLDWAAPLSGPDGRFTSTLDGEEIRMYDGVHLTAAGARRTASATAAWLRLGEQRLWGDDRIGTAIAVAQAMFPAAPTAVLARADNPADALAGGPLAARLGAPLLLTPGDRLDPRVSAELDRLGTNHVVLLGGAAALGAGVERALGARTVERIAGAGRAETAAAIAARIGGDAAFVVDGERGWPDALSVAPLAARLGRPVLLSLGLTLPDATRRALQGRTAATIVGGDASVPLVVEAQLRAIVTNVDRVAGGDRYATSAAVAAAGVTAGLSPAATWLTTGRQWADALAAGAAAGSRGEVLLLVDGASLGYSPAARDFLHGAGTAVTGVRVAGGFRAVSPRVVTEAAMATAA